MIKKILLTFIFNLCLLAFSQSQVIENKSHHRSIKTIQCHKKNWPLSYPIINFGEQLQLSFDDLNGEIQDYYYTIIHCDENWEQSQLMETEYVSGINEVPLLNYQYSFNTSIDYVHYQVNFPNQDIQLRVSGNYIIKIYADGDMDNTILTQRFMLTEQKVRIFPKVKYTMNSDIRDAQQEVSINIKHPNFETSNPVEEVRVHIIQNGRLDNAIIGLKPMFVRNYELDYNYNRETLFEGGNEYRWLDIRSIRFQSSTIKDITFHDPYSHVELFPDEIYAGKSYFFNNDFNGRYVIEVQESNDDLREAEYVYVHFSLPREEPLVGGDVHLLGGLTNWHLDQSSIMKYNFNFKQYEASLLLKQGFYNYQYAFKPNGTDKASVSMFEGSHSKTENDYLILVYYRGTGDYFDRLIGVSQVNSVSGRE
ncbi:type IX secretion system plug protein [Labilibacter marinus]|uniref:type IX secretion system plug protein n=1 Tax=Labilibacter marinus TaxID=1477105 RepID=UPI00094F7305|nr:DUF5103 domain-containing protein [Labilibacter marinus]